MNSMKMRAPSQEDQGLPSTRLWTEKDVAGFLGISGSAVRKWRLFGTGPKYYKIGRAVRYSPTEIKDWLDRVERAA